MTVRPTAASESGKPATGRARKIAILGGGPASLAAAYELTNSPDWRDHYAEITVYQQGFRLGGKLACGRDPSRPWRMEEHGLHVFLGFYQSTLEMLGRCYNEIELDLDDELIGIDRIHFLEKVDDRWSVWPLILKQPPPISALLATGARAGGAHPMHTMNRHLIGLTQRDHSDGLAAAWTGLVKLARDQGLLSVDSVDRDVKTIFAPSELAVKVDRLIAIDAGRNYLVYPELALMLLDHAPDAPDLYRKLMELFRGKHREAGLALVAESDESRRKRVVKNLVATMLVGLSAIGAHHERSSIDALDDVDFRKWLAESGATSGETESAIVDAGYHLTFIDKGTMSAASAIRGAVEMVTFDDALFYMPRGGMGEVFAGVYHALKQRGVRFCFFHSVQDVVARDGAISAIRIRRQVTLAGESYNPFLDEPGGELPRRWRDAPDYAQIERGDELAKRRYDFESIWSPWSAWDGGADVTLRAGEHFDDVILGIPVGALRFACPSLFDASPALKSTAEGLATTATSSVMLWANQPLEDAAGWKRRQGVLAGLGTPFETWADMSTALLQTPGAPKAFVQLCGALEAPAPDPADTGLPGRKQAEVKQRSEDWQKKWVPVVWPEAERTGGGPFVDRTYRANVNPSDRYVQCLASTAARRLDPGGAGIKNLVLAGDWLRTKLNAGCVEAAVMSGIDAARALHPEPRLTTANPQKPYRSLDGDLTWPGPFKYYDSTLYSFVIECNKGVLQALCDSHLELERPPSRSAPRTQPRYEVLGPFALVQYTSTRRATTVDRANTDRGYMKSEAVAVTVPVVRISTNAGGRMTKRFRFFSPYVLASSAQEVAAGRETYGIMKILGEKFRCDTDTFAVSTRVIRKKNSFLELSREPVIEVLRTSQLKSVPEKPPLAQVLTEMWCRLTELGLLDEHNLDESMLLGDGAPIALVGLKQFRNPLNTNEALYQEVVEAPLGMAAWSTGEILEPVDDSKPPYEVVFGEDFENLAIARHLGVAAGGRLPVKLAVRMDLPYYTIG